MDDAISLFKSDLESQNLEEMIDACNKLTVVAAAIGKERTIVDLIPSLPRAMSVPSDEVLAAIGRQLYNIYDIAGGETLNENSFSIILGCIRQLGEEEEILVRQSCVHAFRQIVPTLSPTVVTEQLYPVWKGLATNELFGARHTALCMLPCILHYSSPSVHDEIRRFGISLAHDDSPLVRRKAGLLIHEFAQVIYQPIAQIVSPQSVLPTSTSLQLTESDIAANTIGTHLSTEAKLELIRKTYNLITVSMIPTLQQYAVDDRDYLRAVIPQAVAQLVPYCTLVDFQAHLLPLLLAAADDTSWKVRQLVVQFLPLLATNLIYKHTEQVSIELMNVGNAPREVTDVFILDGQPFNLNVLLTQIFTVYTDLLFHDNNLEVRSVGVLVLPQIVLLLSGVIPQITIDYLANEDRLLKPVRSVNVDPEMNGNAVAAAAATATSTTTTTAPTTAPTTTAAGGNTSATTTTTTTTTATSTTTSSTSPNTSVSTNAPFFPSSPTINQPPSNTLIKPVYTAQATEADNLCLDKQYFYIPQPPANYTLTPHDRQQIEANRLSSIHPQVNREPYKTIIPIRQNEILNQIGSHLLDFFRDMTVLSKVDLCDAFIQIAYYVPTTFTTEYILPIVGILSQDEGVQVRSQVALTLGALAKNVTPTIVTTHVWPIADILHRDPRWRVRRAVCTQMTAIVQVLQDDHMSYIESSASPVIAQLLTENVHVVRNRMAAEFCNLIYVLGVDRIVHLFLPVIAELFDPKANYLHRITALHFIFYCASGVYNSCSQEQFTRTFLSILLEALQDQVANVRVLAASYFLRLLPTHIDAATIHKCKPLLTSMAEDSLCDREVTLQGQLALQAIEKLA